MKRRKIDFEEMTSYCSLYNAWVRCSRGDGKDRRRDVRRYAVNLKENLLRLQQRLRDGTWEPDKGRTFYLRTEGKIREIHTVGVEDRIVHQILVKAFNLQRHFVRRTFGSIKKRGTLRANKQVRKDLRTSGYNYCVKLDVRKYYPSIDKNILIALVRRRYKGEDAIRLYEKVLWSYKPDTDKSISIGALTSQDSGNFYLTPLDLYLLQELKVRCMSRYVDDIVILVRDKEEGERVIRKATEFVRTLGLEFGKILLFPIDKRRIDYCSYAVNGENVRLRASTKRRFIRKLRNLTKRPQRPEYERNCVCSYLGMLQYCNGYKLLKDLRNEYHQVFGRIDRHAERCGEQERETASATAADGRVQNILQPPHNRAGYNRRGNRGTRVRVCTCG
jgi:hypothetical protein